MYRKFPTLCNIKILFVKSIVLAYWPDWADLEIIAKAEERFLLELYSYSNMKSSKLY